MQVKGRLTTVTPAKEREIFKFFSVLSAFVEMKYRTGFRKDHGNREEDREWVQ